MKLRPGVFLAVVVCLASASFPGPDAAAAEFRIAAAADLKFSLDDLTRQFESNHPNAHLHVTYGSSGNFYAQIQQQAPFDLFFSADTGFPQKLVDAGLATQSNLFVYAVGRIVLWVPKSSPLKLDDSGLNALLDPSVHKIAIANPTHAPYGRAAVASLKSLKLYDRVESKLVLGENVAQTAQFVQSGAADAGIIALSLALAPPLNTQGRYLAIPQSAYPKMDQAAVILNSAQDRKIAIEFREFILSTVGRAVFVHSGFGLPDS